MSRVIALCERGCVAQLFIGRAAKINIIINIKININIIYWESYLNQLAQSEKKRSIDLR